MLTVITGWSPQGLRQYGHRFVDTFTHFWPSSVRCIAYVEEAFKHPRIECRLLDDVPGCYEFIDRWKDVRAANGRDPTKGWKENERLAGYSFKWDAVKFCRQAFIPLTAAREIDTGLMCWLDADVVTHKAVPDGIIESLLPEGYDLAFLGRGKKHSEIGFQLYRIPEATEMLRVFRNLYGTNSIFELPEWHSAYAFDLARETSGVRAYNLTPSGTGHVWFQSALGQYLDHCKGDARKRTGHSSERPRL